MNDRSGNVDGYNESTVSSWRPAGVGCGSTKGELQEHRGGHRHRGRMPRPVVSQATLAEMKRDRISSETLHIPNRDVTSHSKETKRRVLNREGFLFGTQGVN